MRKWKACKDIQIGLNRFGLDWANQCMNMVNRHEHFMIKMRKKRNNSIINNIQVNQYRSRYRSAIDKSIDFHCILITIFFIIHVAFWLQIETSNETNRCELRLKQNLIETNWKHTYLLKKKEVYECFTCSNRDQRFLMKIMKKKIRIECALLP